MRRFRRFAFIAVTCAALLLQWPMVPLLAQIVYNPPSGGSTTIVSGTTPITGGATTQVCFNDAATLACGDADLTWDKAGNVLTSAGVFRGSAGTAAAPTFSFTGTTNTGMFSLAANNLDFAGAGAHGMRIDGGNGVIRLGSNWPIAWSTTSNNPTATLDTGFERVAAGVTGSTNGSTGEGWHQNEAGDQFLTADHTNATATPTDLTDLTTTVVSGRKYYCRLYLMQSQSVAADGVRLDFEGGTATMTNMRVTFKIFDGTTLDTVTNVTALATDVTSTDVGTTVVTEAEGSFEPSGNGTIIPRVGLEAASTGTITTQRGSAFTCKDMP